MSQIINSSQSGATEKLADYIANAQFGNLPSAVVKKAKYHILDTLGAMLSGIQLDSGKLIIEFVYRQRGIQESTVIGSNFKTSSILASFANGTLSHADESDDVHPAQVHPGCASIPSALALGEREKIDGKRFINAVVIGYEVAPRIIYSLDRSQLRRRKHAETGISVCFGATAVASNILGLKREQVCSSLGLAGQQVSSSIAIFYGPLHMSKAVDVGIAARNGVTAALLAQIGFLGTPAIFEGQASILDSFSGENYLINELTRDLGSEFSILDSRIKKYPVGGPMQAPLDCLFQIIREQKLETEYIDEIVVNLPETLAWVVRDRPVQDINFDHVIAIGAFHGKLGWEEVHSENITKSKEIIELKKKVRLVGSESLKVGCCNLSLRMKNGSSYNLDGDDSKLCQISSVDVENKFLDLTSQVLGKYKAEKIIDFVNKLEKISDISILADLLRIKDRIKC